jgi:hypothetical protein
MSELELEQRTNIKFLVKHGRSGNEIREMLVQVYGDNAMKKTAVYRGVERSSEGRDFLKLMTPPKILGARRATGSKFYTDYTLLRSDLSVSQLSGHLCSVRVK